MKLAALRTIGHQRCRSPNNPSLRGAAGRAAGSGKRSRPSGCHPSTDGHPARDSAASGRRPPGWIRGSANAQRVDGSFARDQRPRGFHQIARPHQVVSAQIFIALVESPGNRQARDDAADELFGLVAAQDRHAGAVEIDFATSLTDPEEEGSCQLRHWRTKCSRISSQSSRSEDRTCWPDSQQSAPKTQCEHEFSLAGGEINFSCQREIAVFRARVFARGQAGVFATDPASRPSIPTSQPSEPSRT